MRAARDRVRQHLVYALRPLDEATDDPGAIVQLGARRRMVFPIQPSVHGAPQPSTGVEQTSRFARRAAWWTVAYRIFCSVASSVGNFLGGSPSGEQARLGGDALSD